MTIWLTTVFWLAVGLLFYTHVGYPVTLWILEALGVGNRAGQLRGDRVGAFPSLTADEPDTDEMEAYVDNLPEDALVLETDAPDLAPHPHQGTPNRPEYLPLVAAKLAEVRGWSLAETARITANNARRVLRLDHGNSLE